MKKYSFLALLILVSLSLTWCFKDEPEVIDDCIFPDECSSESWVEEFISYYDDWETIREKWTYINWMKEWSWITYDEWWNVINIEEYSEWELIEDEPEPYNMSVSENEIVGIDTLKDACLDQIKDIEPNNPAVTWTEEKLFINAYWFKWVVKSDWMHDWSPTYCNVNLKWLVLSAWFYNDQWQTIDELHDEMDFYNVWWIGNSYPNLKNFYWFIWSIIIWDVLQTNYVSWENTMYYDPYEWFALRLWKEFNWGLIREIDWDEDWYPVHEVIFLVRDKEDTENRTWFKWFRELFSIKVISKENLENFKVTPDFQDSIVWENNEFIFVWNQSDINANSSDFTIFDL